MKKVRTMYVRWWLLRFSLSFVLRSSLLDIRYSVVSASSFRAFLGTAGAVQVLSRNSFPQAVGTR
jgi:hypothetical protein